MADSNRASPTRRRSDREDTERLCTRGGHRVSDATRTQGTFLGHPKGLFILFLTELWERFSFYSMRGVLTLYTAGVVLAALGPEAGGQADAIYGAYLGFVYSSTFIGGMLADRLLGSAARSTSAAR